MKHLPHLGLAWALVSCAEPGGPPPSSATPTDGYVAIPLGTLEEWTSPAGLNDIGQVVGQSGGTYSRFAFIAADGAMRQLDSVTGKAGAINARGQIAGLVGLAGTWNLTRWDAQGAAGGAAGGSRLEMSPIPGWAGTMAINEAGDVLAGIDGGGTLIWHGGAGTPQDIGYLSAHRVTEPAGLNERGQIVGRSVALYAEPDAFADPYANPADFDANYAYFHPILWDGALRDLGVFGKASGCTRSAPCARGAATAINELGVVVGYSEDSAFIRRPFLWRDGVLYDIGAFPGEHAVARAINDRGQVAGDGEDGAFLWENGVTRLLGALGGGYIEVTAMNARGDVAGTALTAAGEQHAFVWTGGRMIDLGIGGGIPGAHGARAVAINDRGDVLVAVAMECFKNDPADPRLCNFGYIRPQRAVLFRRA